MTKCAAYEELYVYAMGRPGFLLQHVVDAFGAQTATPETKPIRIVFSLVGLHLHVDKKLDGRQVQQVHMRMGREKRVWPEIALPQDRGDITVNDILASAEGADRDQAIDAWCRSVWTAFHKSRQTIVELLHEYQIG